MSRIEATPGNIFSWGFDLHAEQSHLLTIDMMWLREGGSFHWQGAAYSLGRESRLAGKFFLEHHGEAVATAVKPSPFLRTFHVRAGPEDFVLKAVSPFTRRFTLEKDTQAVGRITPRGPFTRSAIIELPDRLTVPVQVFIFWLVALMWRRAAGSTAATT